MTTSAPNPEPQWWERHDYFHGRHLYGVYWLVVIKMAFTWRVALCTPDEVIDFCCFERLSDALICWSEWDGTGIPSGPWTRHHRSGYRQIGGVRYHEDGITPVDA